MQPQGIEQVELAIEAAEQAQRKSGCLCFGWSLTWSFIF